jgi:2-amino-4-hydroxy-6-hydroxymethyldihydropteridine diphosphokinase
MIMTNSIYLLLGSNLGNSRELLEEAIRNVGIHLGEIIETSKLYKTAPWGKAEQPPFLNQVVRLKSELPPKEMLTKIHLIESKMGRIRQEKWGQRIIDIDILYYNDLIFNSLDLKLPHPEIQNRRFTLVPLVDLSPDFIHPILQLSNSDLLAKCEDKLDVELLE